MRERYILIILYLPLALLHDLKAKPQDSNNYKSLRAVRTQHSFLLIFCERHGNLYGDRNSGEY